MTSINLLGWRLYRDVLNFEEESFKKFEIIKNLLKKEKLSKRDDRNLAKFSI
jgi:hypothetical protein